MREIEKINPTTLVDAAEMGYAQITSVEAGRMIFISGQVAWSADGTPTPPDLAGQSKIVAQNLLSALTAAEAAPENIVSARMFIVDLSPEKAQEAFEPLASVFHGNPTAFTTVGVTSLAAPDLLIELEAIAVV